MLEQGLKLDKSSPEAKKFLYALMTLMEQVGTPIPLSLLSTFIR